MELITDTQRSEALEKLDDVSKALYLNSDNGETLFAAYKKANITGNHYRKYALAIGDTILGFHQTKDLPTLLQQQVGVTPEVAQKIVADLAEFLAPVLEREAAGANAKSNNLKALHETFKPTTPVAATAPAADPNKPPIAVPGEGDGLATEPAATHDVTPMRTMAADMSRVHGYGAYRKVADETHPEPVIKSAPQDELLKDRPRLAGVPTVGE